MSAGKEHPHNWSVNCETSHRLQAPAAQQHLGTTSHSVKDLLCSKEREEIEIQEFLLDRYKKVVKTYCVDTVSV